MEKDSLKLLQCTNIAISCGSFHPQDYRSNTAPWLLRGGKIQPIRKIFPC